MTKTSVKFCKNRYKTVGVAPTRYLLLYGDGRMDGRKDGWTEEGNEGEAKTKSLRFSSKRRGTSMDFFFNVNTMKSGWCFTGYYFFKEHHI